MQNCLLKWHHLATLPNKQWPKCEKAKSISYLKMSVRVVEIFSSTLNRNGTTEFRRFDVFVTTTNSTKFFDVLTGHRRTRTSVSTPKPTLLASLPIVMLIATFRIDKLMRYFVVDEFKWSSSLASKCSVKIAENFNHSIIGADVCS